MPTASASAIQITGMDLIGATVPDLKRSMRFYRDILGLVPAVDGEGGAEFHFADGTTFGLWHPPAKWPPTPGCATLSPGTHARAAPARSRARGATIADAFDSSVCTMATGTDPEGNGFMLHHRHERDEHRPPAQQRTPPTIHGLDVAGYLVSDAQGQIAFYREVLGLAPSEIDEQGRGAEFDLADGSTFGVWRTPEGNRCGFVMFAVQDAKAKAEELRAKGVAISELTETPVCTMAFCADPDGNGVIVHQRKHA